MNTDFLKYVFVACAYRCGSLSKTAEICNYTQPYVSKTIQRFEEELGIRLFERYKHGVRPREEAMPVIRRIVAFLEDYERFENELFRRADDSCVTVALTASFSCFRMPACMREFKALHPDIRIELKVGTYSGIEEMIEESAVDFGISSLPMRKGIVTVPLMPEPDVVICGKTHPLAEKRIFPPDGFRGETLIATREGDDKYIRELYGNTECEPETITVINNDQTLIHMVRQGLGISVLPEIMVREYADQIAVLDFSGYLSRKIGIGTLRGRRLRAEAALLAGYLLETFSDAPARKNSFAHVRDVW